MRTPDDQPPTPPIEPETNLERELLEGYRDLDEADRVMVWSALLRLLAPTLSNRSAGRPAGHSEGEHHQSPAGGTHPAPA
ncbi:MAG: hypothetical protein M3R02_21415 [Chloroflexota bacterium]|nr:hypothetical protein [Chloroflexota bacterium]